ncbi:efflux RND transporter periplasmic adaptor subunit [Vibrio sp. SCSIO 43136]|uniref:efflux RND transporter periplasmic adaptor subunit n=1 Tax=Vibrio sp. SCSIO 43136 TaxID=2819101 RepID=UPI002074FE1F|nr:efflux RND transporter periplasmic adaptor subunit [Vibrio sp. SCSIO 43136]USD67438.1 efflux RND transporter periplasmic adaptor subunit [Vibrio sp. SCSIO 43136]
MKLNPTTIVITLAAAGTVFGAVSYTAAQMGPPPSGKGEKPAQSERQASEQIQKPSSTPTLVLPEVEVQTATSASYRAEVVGFGEAHAAYELNFAAEVSGSVLSLGDSFKTGQIVKKGTVLAKLDATSYQQAVAQASAEVASAKLAYLEEERQAMQAKAEWKSSGLSGEPDSTLVLREPQLANAKAALANAEQSLKKAKSDLAKTTISAPFDALVISRDIQPGSYVQTGSQIASLYSIDSIEIDIPLSEAQWHKMPSMTNQEFAEANWPVTLISADGQTQWQGYIDRIEQHLSTQTRQRDVVIVVDNPLTLSQPLYPGTFVQANIQGEQIDTLWELPASAISQQGEIWTVNANGVLVNTAVTTAFEKQDKVYISSQSESAQVVKRPLSSFKAGMKVSPKVEG